ncbi:MAG TPA: helix-turn-helix domain-containing protein [Acidobacteriota bacterium]|nr:helix-turn-helix domain-containing protein [Acidobacteriota bacterium]HQO19028.1 helix-turn-helix domain-containing protein [Acidobacteriota bacterium]HQQ45921.1 helix-turn-helix domain-containing protein [Acidobacteriota bacterium]
MATIELIMRQMEEIKKRLEELRPAFEEYVQLKDVLRVIELASLGRITELSPPGSAPRNLPPEKHFKRPEIPLGPRSIEVLGLVRERPGMSAGQLASKSGIHTSNIHRALRSLEARGLVVRKFVKGPGGTPAKGASFFPSAEKAVENREEQQD